MAARRVEFHVAARAELVDAIAYYESRTAGLGEQFYGEARRILSLIAEHPEIGMPIWMAHRTATPASSRQEAEKRMLASRKRRSTD